jgi:hypothetical protein
MKKNVKFLLVGLVLVVSILACDISVNTGDLAGERIRGSGDIAEEDRDVSGMSRVELAMTGTLHIEVGDNEELRIEAEDNLLDYIETDVRGGELVIETRQGYDLDPTRSIEYFLTVTELEAIRLSSDGDAEAPELQAERFSINIDSSGSLNIDSLDCPSLDVEISSSGNVSISELTGDTISIDINSNGDLEIAGGQVEGQDISISSSGEYRANDLASLVAVVDLSSNGSATIRVSDRLSGTLSSSGFVYYIGDPELDVSTTSSGRAEQIDE